MSKGRNVIVLGGSSGIGEATAGSFVERGYTTFIGGRDAARLEAAAARTGATPVRVDATSTDSVRALSDRVEAIDHLVLALSGGAGAGSIRTLALADLRAGFEAKLFAHLTSLQALLPRLREGGSITFISAISARAALPGTAGLAAINGAIESMVRPLAVELAPTRVNAVSPGVIDTPWWDAMPPAAKADVFAGAARSLPVRRVGRPSDVAAAVVMLAENAFMTGTVVEVDGGAHLAR